MYAKVFRQIYDSTLADDWRALVTFQQLLVLADAEGLVDMTTGAIHRVTNIPQEIITEGLEKLQQPDPRSRSSKEDGRRVVLIDTDRDWGWRIVNYGYYRDLASREDKKRKDRERISEKRNKNKDVAECRGKSQKVADVAHTEAEADTEAKERNTRAPDGALAGFDRFWSAYPKKKSKGDARKAWKSLKPNEQLQDRMLRALERAKTSAEWRKDAGQFIPYPATWLRAEGWEDEVQAPRRVDLEDRL